MITLNVQLRLLTDAEPGTGLGNEVINALVPTDERGSCIIPASHLKGLLRDQVYILSLARNWPRDLRSMLFGEGGDTASGGVGIQGRLVSSDAQAPGDPVKPTTITRTRVGEVGTADAGSLRTTEAIPAGTVFSAELQLDAESGSLPDLVLRLALMSIEALGGGRTRGAGRCRISIEGETRTPGTLLRVADEATSDFELVRTEPAPVSGYSLDGAEAGWYRLSFRATTPICCPEVPINGATNHIRSGPVIPASAVQGALLTLISRRNPALATACLLDPRFRAWPLVPIQLAGAVGSDATADDVVMGVRVDLSHRTSKLPRDDGTHFFCDPAVEPVHWSENPSGSPMKSSDGILRRHRDGKVDLWKAGELPRRITAHGVHDDPGGERRNLFSVEALAPMVFTGLVSLPRDAAQCLEELLAEDSGASFGKARSVRGRGVLSLDAAPSDELFSPDLPQGAGGRVFIVQSALAIPDDYRFQADGGYRSAEAALCELASDWGEVELRTVRPVHDEEREVARTAATCGVRFGWNRHGVGNRAEARHRRLRARRVFLPGSVIVFKQPVADVARRLLAGLGEGREEGFGCLLPHPGIAVDVYRPHELRRPERLTSRDSAGVEGRRLFDEARQGNGPTPSQIGALASRIRTDGTAAIEHLERQMRRGPARHWQRWQPVTKPLVQLLKSDPDLAKRALRVWQDLAIANRPEKEER